VEARTGAQTLVDSLTKTLQDANADLEARTGVRLSLNATSVRIQRELRHIESPGSGTTSPDRTAHTAVQQHRVRQQQSSTVDRSGRRRIERHFFQRTESLAYRLDARRAGAVRTTRTTLQLQFRVDIRMNFSLLERFAAQAEALADRNDGTLDAYLRGTDASVRRGPETLARLFDLVDAHLQDAEQRFVGQLEAFLEQIGQEERFAGLDIDGLRDQVVDMIHRSFDAARTALGAFRAFDADQVRADRTGAAVDLAA
jgi:hypothetical protein